MCIRDSYPERHRPVPANSGQRQLIELTIVGRNGYEAGTDELINPRQLRRVNEVQNKVTACLSQLLEGECPDGFVESIAQRVLAEDDDELKCMLERSMASSEKVRSIEMTALGRQRRVGQHFFTMKIEPSESGPPLTLE